MFEKGELNSEQASLPEGLEASSLDMMLPGSVANVSWNALWFDEQYKCWIDSTELLNPEEYTQDCVKVIRFDEGFVVDLYSLEEQRPATFRRYHSEELIEMGYSIDNFKPVIGLIQDLEGAEALAEIFREKFGYEMGAPRPSDKSARLTVIRHLRALRNANAKPRIQKNRSL